MSPTESPMNQASSWGYLPNAARSFGTLLSPLSPPRTSRMPAMSH